MSKDMCARNHPNFNTGNGLTQNGGRPLGAPPGSTLEGTGAASSRASSPAFLLLFAPGTAAATGAGTGGFGGLAADVDELVGPFARLSRDAGVQAVEAVEAAPVAGLGTTQASSRSGTAVSDPDVEPDALPPAGTGVRVGWPVGALAAADRRAFTPSPGGLAAGG